MIGLFNKSLRETILLTLTLLNLLFSSDKDLLIGSNIKSGEKKLGYINVIDGRIKNYLFPYANHISIIRNRYCGITNHDNDPCLRGNKNFVATLIFSSKYIWNMIL